MSTLSRLAKSLRKASTLLLRRVVGRASREVWPTFDDGPHPEHTPRVLDALQEAEVKATFFVCGEEVARWGGALPARAAAEGHRLGVHGFRHVDLTRLDPRALREELRRTLDLVEEHGGPCTLFRPPFGATNATVEGVAAELGCRTVLWNVDPRDWDPSVPPDAWVRSGVEQVRRLPLRERDLRASACVVLHDVYAATASGLPRFLQQVRGLGDAEFARPADLP